MNHPLDIAALRKLKPQIICLGSHPGIIQSILDFDYLAGRTRPSIVAIVAAGRKIERYFFGLTEVVLPVYETVDRLPAELRPQINLFLNLSSGRRVLASTHAALAILPSLAGGVVFAEGFPETHALQLADVAEDRGLWIAGAASVGLVIPGLLKLGAIGGVQADQLEASRLFEPGSVAVISCSGGMVGELIRAVATSGHSLSFSLALGGERFPLISPIDAFLAAEADPKTKAIVYFGELGGTDEYQLADLIRVGKITKPVLAYIAGTVAELFDTPPQFGHAKAMAANLSESAQAKSDALRAAGAHATKTFSELISLVKSLPGTSAPGENTGSAQASASEHGGAGSVAGPAHQKDSVRRREDAFAEATTQTTRTAASLESRRPALIASSISRDSGGTVEILGTDLLAMAETKSFAAIAISLFLGRPIKSPELEQFVDFVLRLLVDHGPYVSGAVNTIITARAGRDLESALAAGLLTIGPRFGGAINQAAATWLTGATSGQSAAELVESLAQSKQYISGIGHRRYRSDQPDPRVHRLLEFTGPLKAKIYTTFALAVEAETIRKKGNLILNVDGAVAAILLDLLSEKEGYTPDQLQALIDTEFFNALFVLSRSVGFMAHYFDQRRLDEGLFRLSSSDIAFL